MQGKWVSPSPKQQQQPVLISFLRSLAHTHTHTHTHTYTHGISCIWGPGWVGWGGGTRLSQPNSPHFRSLAPLPPPASLSPSLSHTVCMPCIEKGLHRYYNLHAGCPSPRLDDLPRPGYTRPLAGAGMPERPRPGQAALRVYRVCMPVHGPGVGTQGLKQPPK